MKIDKNGVAVVELNIKRKQNREKSIPYIDPRDNNFTYLIKENISNIRVVIPKNSVILQKDGLSEFKKITSNEFVDIYEFNSQLIPLIESSYKLTYKLPFNFSAVGPINVDSFIQMQNGGWLYNFTNTLEVPSDWDLLASNKRELSIKSNEVMYSKIVDKDIFLSFIYEKK
jgi:phage pi2 protein 07